MIECGIVGDTLDIRIRLVGVISLRIGIIVDFTEMLSCVLSNLSTIDVELK